MRRPLPSIPPLLEESPEAVRATAWYAAVCVRATRCVDDNTVTGLQVPFYNFSEGAVRDTDPDRDHLRQIPTEDPNCPTIGTSRFAGPLRRIGRRRCACVAWQRRSPTV